MEGSKKDAGQILRQLTLVKCENYLIENLIPFKKNIDVQICRFHFLIPGSVIIIKSVSDHQSFAKRLLRVYETIPDSWDIYVLDELNEKNESPLKCDEVSDRYHFIHDVKEIKYDDGKRNYVCVDRGVLRTFGSEKNKMHGKQVAIFKNISTSADCYNRAIRMMNAKELELFKEFKINVGEPVIDDNTVLIVGRKYPKSHRVDLNNAFTNFDIVIQYYPLVGRAGFISKRS
ncbi:MAG: hypothetical protein Hyperionvirus1_157 [Hyperionvirus sp.]|uniref:Uncharacterized protein n=1 Tax=Hyperionvirus sp. TaxID=2487770 RepID=A0A3G5A5X2_9VIRU|nr:MAG: hypothetical protein Hyperionvirus1_157 [Hyperionvirus sp.]